MSATGHLRDDVMKDPATLEREADEARADLARTIGTLEARLSPGELIDRSIEVVKQNGGDFGRNLGAQVRNNPLPTILAGIGIAWLAGASKRPPLRQESSSDTDLRDRAASVVGSAQAGAGSVVDGTREAIDKTKSAARSVAGATRKSADSLGQTGRAAADAARRGARSARDGYTYLQQEQPLILGALAVVAGAAIGAAFPTTRTEDQWLGERSEDAKRRAKEFGKDKIRQAERKAADTAEAIEEAVDDQAASRNYSYGRHSGGDTHKDR